MKRFYSAHYLCIYFSVFIIVLVNQQISQAQSFTAGAKVGFQSTGVYTDPEIIGRENGFSFFLYADYSFVEFISFEQNVGFIQRGFRHTKTLINEDGHFIDDITAASNMNYLGYNPMFHFQWYTPDYARAFVGIGPRFEYLISKSNGVFDFPDGTQEDEIAAAYDDFLIGISFSTGLKDVDIGDITIRFSVAYELDITDSVSGLESREARNNALLFTIGFGI